MKTYLRFTFKKEVEFNGFYLHVQGHPWLFVVMEEPYYKILLEKELFVHHGSRTQQSVAQQYGVTEWSDQKRGFYPERLAKQMMVMDYLKVASRKYVYFPHTSPRKPKYPFLAFLDSDIKNYVEGISQSDSLPTDNTNKQDR